MNFNRRVCAVVLIALLFPLRSAGQQRRALTPDDLFRLEEIGDVALAPDGRSVAYVLRRPKASASVHKQDFLQGNDRADIWLATVDGSAAPRNLTNGAADGSGYWMPVWSPDSSRIAMLSTKDDNVRLWVWERATGQVRRLTDRAVNITGAPPFAWVSDGVLAASLLPEGEQPTSMTVERRAATVAMREWPKAWKGQETTASVLDSGVPVDLSRRPQGQFVILPMGRAAQVVATAPVVRDLRVSPDRRHVAFLKQFAMMQPDPARLLQHGAANRFGSEDRYQIVVADAGGRIVSGAPAAVTAVLPGTLQWAPGGTEVSFIGAPAGSPSDRLRAYRLGAAGGEATAVGGDDLDPRATAWSSAGLLVSGETKGADGKPRRDWWLVEAGKTARNLTASMKNAPGELLPEPGVRTFVGVADGDVWRVDPAGAATNLTEAFAPKVESIVWPSAAVPRDAGFSQIVLGVQREMFTDLHRLDLTSRAIESMARPSDLSTLTAWRPEGGVTVFTALEPTGTTLTLARTGAAPRALVETNRFLSEIGEGGLRKIDYRGMGGQDLKAWVILPPEYKEGTRYPVVTWVYAGSMVRDVPSLLARINVGHSLNLQLLAARGYVVLMPSMPLTPEGQQGSDPYMELTAGVLPAVDKLIDLGIADPKRLAVMGQSYGGFSTYGLVTLTNRFQAAIALAGLGDLVGMYGIFDARSRYEPYPHERLFSQSISETGQVRMGNPPWKDAGRYLRNSPLFYVDRVQTPLLIVQGDMDYVTMTQGEQFFTALYRQGKRARFVRYWGEGHVLDSPANIRDLWTQIYGWLDEHLKPAPSTPTAQRP